MIDIPQLILDTQKILEEDKEISTSLRTIINLLLVVIDLQHVKVSKNSRNSSTPPSQDPNRPKKLTKNKKKQDGQEGHLGLLLREF